MTKADKPRRHASTRYQDIPDETIEELQRTHRTGGDLYRAAPWLSHENKRIVVAVTLDADAITDMPLRRLLSDEAGPGPTTDFKRAVVADLLASAPGPATMDARAKLLQEAGRSPTASPMLDYEPLFRDLAEAALLAEAGPDGAAAIDWLKRAVAHNLRHHKGDDVRFTLIDLASAYLQVGDLDLGLSMLSRLIRQDPADVWVYRFMATGLGVVGLSALGVQGATRGLDLLDELGDPEDMHDEFLMTQFELQTDPSRGREAEVSPEVLRDLEAALALDHTVGGSETPQALCQDLIPDWADVPVKTLLRFQDLPLPVQRLVV